MTDFSEILHVAIILTVENDPVDRVSKFEVFVDLWQNPGFGAKNSVHFWKNENLIWNLNMFPYEFFQLLGMHVKLGSCTLRKYVFYYCSCNITI